MKAKNIEAINSSFERQAENFESRKLAFSKQEYLDYTLKTVKPRKTDSVLEVAAGNVRLRSLVRPTGPFRYKP